MLNRAEKLLICFMRIWFAMAIYYLVILSHYIEFLQF